MSEFNRMTIVAAAEVISAFNSHSDMEVLEVQWGIAGRCSSSSKSARVAGMARIAANEDIEVMTVEGRMSLSRALIEKAIRAPDDVRCTEGWKKLVAGLRFDGFEIVVTEVETENPWQNGQIEKSGRLARMLPSDVPEMDFREAENEVVQLLEQHGFDVAKGHQKRAISAFSRGDWSAANGELRNFIEGLLNNIAERLGYAGEDNSKAKRDFLGACRPPFLRADYNEWNVNNQKSQFVQGLMSRLHPHGGHPGLSEEEDATFRLQITLVTARLFLRRFDQRCGS